MSLNWKHAHLQLGKRVLMSRKNFTVSVAVFEFLVFSGNERRCIMQKRLKIALSFLNISRIVFWFGQLNDLRHLLSLVGEET